MVQDISAGSSEDTTGELADKSASMINSIRPPTVLQVLPELVTGGVERGTVDIAGAIVDGGGRAIVASAGGPMTHELARLGAEHVTLPVQSKNPFVIQKNIHRLADLAFAENVDIIHGRSRASAWSALYAAKKSGKHFITTFHGTYGHVNSLKRAYNSVMTKGTRVIAISNFIAGHIRQVYGVPTANIRVIPRGVDLTRFNPEVVSRERIISLAKKWRLPDGVPVIMLPGRLTRWKGQKIFIEAIKELARTDIQCLIVGSDQGRHKYRRELERFIESHGMTGSVHVIGHCDDMPAAYMLSDIVVSASLEPEAFGRVAAEAQALGRQIIAADHGGARETIIHGETGWLTPPGDAKALAETINAVLATSDAGRQKLSERAKSHIQKNFSKERMCERTLDVYNDVLSLKPSDSGNPRNPHKPGSS